MSTGRRRHLAVLVPTYNEVEALPRLVENLERVVPELGAAVVTLIVIDDDSPDGTGALADQLSAEPRSGLNIEVIHRTQKAGLGSAYVAGLRHVLDGNFDIVLQMDADMSHDPSYIPTFLAAAAHADFVVGSRYVRGGSTPDWSMLRKALSRGGNRYARLWLGSSITDYTGGFNLYTSDLLSQLDFEQFRAEGYGFLIELKHAALGVAHRTVQIPIVFMDRSVGESKIPRATILKNLFLVPRLRFARSPVRGRAPYALIDLTKASDYSVS